MSFYCFSCLMFLCVIEHLNCEPGDCLFSVKMFLFVYCGCVEMCQLNSHENLCYVAITAEFSDCILMAIPSVHAAGVRVLVHCS